MIDITLAITALVMFLAIYFYFRSQSKPVTVVDLICYPIKSCAGINLSRSEITISGLKDDRKWAILHESLPVSQTRDPRLLKLQPIFKYNPKGEQTHLVLSYPGYSDFLLKISDEGAPKEFSLKNANGEYSDEGDEAAQWLSEIFGNEYRLGRIVKFRNLNETDAQKGSSLDSKLSFAGKGQFLILSLEDIENLKENVPEESKNFVKMECFRPNIVVKNLRVFEEDCWDEFSIGGVRMKGIEKCTRCKMTTLDLETCEFAKSGEPLNTLRRIHADTAKVYLGLLAVHLSPGTIQIGDLVKVISKTQR